MSIVTPNQGEQLILENNVNKTAPQDLVLKLYENNITPGESDTELTYTEATFPGYAAKTLTGANWTATQGAPTEIAYALQAFVATGAGNSVYGYTLEEATSGKLKHAERFTGAPYAIVNNGDTINVTPKITAD